MTGVAATELRRLLQAAGVRETSPYRCRVCNGEMDAFLATIGTHPGCDPDATMPEPPPSTLPELTEALVELEAARPRSQQVELGPSEIGVPCDRRLAYSLRLPKPPEDTVKWAAMMGTAVDGMISGALVLANQRLGRERWIVHREVWPDLSVHGSCDAYDVDTETVHDWKLVNPDHIKPTGPRGGAAGKYREDPGQQYRVQAQLYGLGWQRAGYTPRWVRIVFLPRAGFMGGAHEWTAPYDRGEAEAALDRMYRMLALTKDLDVDHNPSMWGIIPALPTKDCRQTCPFYRWDAEAPTERGCPGDGKGATIPGLT